MGLIGISVILLALLLLLLFKSEFCHNLANKASFDLGRIEISVCVWVWVMASTTLETFHRNFLESFFAHLPQVYCIYYCPERYQIPTPNCSNAGNKGIYISWAFF